MRRQGAAAETWRERVETLDAQIRADMAALHRLLLAGDPTDPSLKPRDAVPDIWRAIMGEA